MDVHAERRAKLLEKMEDGAVAIFPTGVEVRRSNDTEFAFRPDSDFYYLTGFEEPEAVAVISKNRGRAFTLFLRTRDKERETWTGRRLGPERAKETLGVDEAFAFGDLDAKMPALLADATAVYANLGRYPDFDRRVVGWIDAVRMKHREGLAPRRVIDPGTILHELRLRKTPRDLETLKRAISISAEGHREAMAATRPGMKEYEIQAIVEYVFKRRGAQAPGYGSIVGAGANATILHYVTNRDELKAGELLLVDAGAEVDLYTGDITRTWPIDGKFTKPQRKVYEIVLDAQKLALAECKAGSNIQRIHEVTVRRLVEGLAELKLLEESVDASLESGSYKRFYMHRTSHWLGMDVHDVGDYLVPGRPAEKKPTGNGLAADYPYPQRQRKLEPGMVFTVEPGLYVMPDERLPSGADPALRGIGVRIEDDVLVTNDGIEILSREAPKDPADVEREMTRKSIFTT